MLHGLQSELWSIAGVELKLRLEFRPSVLFRRSYLVGWTSARALKALAPDCDAFAVSLPLLLGEIVPVVLAPKPRQRDLGDAFRSVLEHEFVHVNQMLTGITPPDYRVTGHQGHRGCVLRSCGDRARRVLGAERAMAQGCAASTRAFVQRVVTSPEPHPNRRVRTRTHSERNCAARVAQLRAQGCCRSVGQPRLQRARRDLVPRALGAARRDRRQDDCGGVDRRRFRLSMPSCAGGDVRISQRNSGPPRREPRGTVREVRDALRGSASPKTPPAPKPEPVRRPDKVVRMLVLARQLQSANDGGLVADRAVGRGCAGSGSRGARLRKLLDLFLLAPHLQVAGLALEAVNGAPRAARGGACLELGRARDGGRATPPASLRTLTLFPRFSLPASARRCWSRTEPRCS